MLRLNRRDIEDETSTSRNGRTSSAVADFQGSEDLRKSNEKTKPARSSRKGPACANCRRRKVKCGGGMPCAHCIHSNKSCHYEATPLQMFRSAKQINYRFQGDDRAARLEGPYSPTLEMVQCLEASYENCSSPMNPSQDMINAHFGFIFSECWYIHSSERHNTSFTSSIQSRIRLCEGKLSLETLSYIYEKHRSFFEAWNARRGPSKAETSWQIFYAWLMDMFAADFPASLQCLRETLLQFHPEEFWVQEPAEWGQYVSAIVPTHWPEMLEAIANKKTLES